jgi:hypothetical protein
MLGMPGVFAAAATVCLAAVLWKGEWRDLGLGLWLAWIAAAVPVFLVVGARSQRYLFFLFPPLLAVGYALLLRGGRLLFGEGRGWRVPVLFVAAWFVTAFFITTEYLRGPAEAAAAVVRGVPSRVLYAGDADGNFVFAVRALDPKLQTTVIPGQKLAGDVFTPAAFEDFCRRYAIHWVVLEETAASRRWAGLVNASAPSMQLERILPMDSSRPRWRGKIYVYRFLSPAPVPEAGLELPVQSIGEKIDVQH